VPACCPQRGNPRHVALHLLNVALLSQGNFFSNEHAAMTLFQQVNLILLLNDSCSQLYVALSNLILLQLIGANYQCDNFVFSS